MLFLNIVRLKILIFHHTNFSTAFEENIKEILEIESDGQQHSGTLESHPAIWQYKTRISIEDMSNKLLLTKDNADEQFIVLKYFMRRVSCKLILFYD